MALEGPGKPVEGIEMAKRPRTQPTASSVPTKPARGQPRPGVVHSSLYLPEPIYEALREAAFEERCKIHDVVMEGISLALKRRGYAGFDDLKAVRKR
jgi:hypothetical protein